MNGMSEAEKANRRSGQPHRNGAPRDSRSFGEHCREIYDDTDAFVAAVRDATDELGRYLTEQVEERPYATLGMAAGAGYVLGGGLRPRFTAVLLGAATRAVMALAVSEVAAWLSPDASASVEKAPSREGGEDRSMC